MIDNMQTPRSGYESAVITSETIPLYTGQPRTKESSIPFLSKYKKLAKNTGKVAVCAVLAVGAVNIYNGVMNELHHFGLNIDIGGTTSPDAAAAVKGDTYTTEWVNLDCPDEVRVDVGVHSSQQIAYISGINEGKTFPIRFLDCGKKGVLAREKIYKDKNDKVDKVVVDEPFYSPEVAGVDFNRGQVICMSLGEYATKAQIANAAAGYDKAKSKGQNVHCDFRLYLTGAGFASTNDAAISMTTDYLAAVNAASLSPIPKYAQNEIDKAIKTTAKEDVLSQYPNAEVIINTPNFKSPLKQIEQNWLVNSADITNSSYVKNINAEKTGNTLQFNQTLIYDGSTIHYTVPANLTQSEVSQLNSFIKNKANTDKYNK